jgi:diaminopimelate epimerase
MKKFDFIKMHGLGNDFVIIDERNGELGLSTAEIVSIANRHTGVGCDQLITISYDSKSNFFIRFFNSSGEEVSACGNGSRCVARILMEENKNTEVLIKTKAGFLQCKKITEKIISINLGKPKFNWNEIPLDQDYKNKAIIFEINDVSITNPYFVNVGNPHSIFLVSNLENYNIDEFGPLIENDKMFPEKCNVSIAQIISPIHIKINVWERGAGKTLACGTAACATAVAAYKSKLTESKVRVSLPGGDLNIEYNEDIIMSGTTEFSFNSSFELS